MRGSESRSALTSIAYENGARPLSFATFLRTHLVASAAIPLGIGCRAKFVTQQYLVMLLTALCSGATVLDVHRSSETSDQSLDRRQPSTGCYRAHLCPRRSG